MTALDDDLKQHAPLVRRIAAALKYRIASNVELDDLIQVGMIGLQEALARFDQSGGASLEPFAVPRIRGAMLDLLRQDDRMNRRDRRHLRDVAAATQRLQHELGRQPTGQETADAAGISLARLHELRDAAEAGLTSSLDGAPDDDGEGARNDRQERRAGPSAGTPLDRMLDRERRHAVVDAIAGLGEADRELMAMYYERGMHLHEIALLYGITESAVSLRHSRIVRGLGVQLRALAPD